MYGRDDRLLQQAAAYLAPQIQHHLNRLERANRVNEQRAEQLSQQVQDLTAALNATKMQRVGPTPEPDVIRIENIPGRRVPFMLVADIPIDANTTSLQQVTVPITMEGPFVAVKRSATFVSNLEFQTTDLAGVVLRYSGRSYGRYRPISSSWDIMDGHYPVDTAVWWMAWLNQIGVVGQELPHAAINLPSNISGYRTMEFDGRISIQVAGSTMPRQNQSVPSSFWSEAINSPVHFGALDFYERGEAITFKVQPNHVSNPPAGNIDGTQVFPVVGAAGWPFLAGQYDAHEGIATPGASHVGALTPNLPHLLATDAVQRVPQGILTICLEGYRILQIPGPAL